MSDKDVEELKDYIPGDILSLSTALVGIKIKYPKQISKLHVGHCIILQNKSFIFARITDIYSNNTIYAYIIDQNEDSMILNIGPCHIKMTESSLNLRDFLRRKRDLKLDVCQLPRINRCEACE